MRRVSRPSPLTAPPQIVPACKPFTISWQPTTSNSVSLILLRGPSTNVVPLSTIVTGIVNSGSFVWSPSSSLEADTTHYGLQLIDDVTGQFQYSTQFGISKGAECNGVVASSAVSTPYGGGYPVSTVTPSSKAVSTHASASGYPVSSVVASSSKANSTIVTKASTPVIYSTGVPAGNSSIIQPTKPLSVPGSLVASATGSASATRSSLPQSTGAAGSLKAGLGLVGAAAAMAFML
jgi:hypothetical protein